MARASIDSLKLNEIVKLVDSFKNKADVYPSIRIAFLRNITIDILIPYLKLLCYEEALAPDILMGDYDNVLQEVLDQASPIYAFNPNLIVVVLKLETLSDKLVNGFCALRTDDINEELDRITGLIEAILTGIRSRCDATILIHNFEVPVYPAFGVLDCQDGLRQVNIIRRLNNEIVAMANKHESAYVVDVDLVQSMVGYKNFRDQRYWHIGKAPYTRHALKAIAKEYIKFIRALKGRNKKCLVLDCDNTLWGGIIGEDGINNIKISTTYPGSMFQEFQKAIMNLYNRGIMLGICSKNNQADVLEVLENHPDMILRKDHFISIHINWQDKVTNLQKIASELNIGLDSIVFVDDNEFETNLVEKMLPQVTTILLPKDSSIYNDLLNSCGLFDTLAFSEEDSKRSRMYKAEVKRKDTRLNFSTQSLDGYFNYLEMKIIIKNADDFSITRIAQLTQRTNQFNLTTKRYQEAEIKQLVDSNYADIRYLRLEDRFGDSGIVGVAILKYIEDKCLIDTFLLSCRVIGRGIEDVLLRDCLCTARQKEYLKVVGFYIATKRNSQVANFFKNRGFKSQNISESKKSFMLLLDNKSLLDIPNYFKNIESDGV